MIPLKVVRLVKLVTPLGDALLFNRLEGSDGLSRNGEYRVTVLSRRPDIKGDESIDGLAAALRRLWEQRRDPGAVPEAPCTPGVDLASAPLPPEATP